MKIRQRVPVSFIIVALIINILPWFGTFISIRKSTLVHYY